MSLKGVVGKLKYEQEEPTHSAKGEPKATIESPVPTREESWSTADMSQGAWAPVNCGPMKAPPAERPLPGGGGRGGQ